MASARSRCRTASPRSLSVQSYSKVLEVENRNSSRASRSPLRCTRTLQSRSKAKRSQVALAGSPAPADMARSAIALVSADSSYWRFGSASPTSALSRRSITIPRSVCRSSSAFAASPRYNCISLGTSVGSGMHQLTICCKSARIGERIATRLSAASFLTRRRTKARVAQTSASDLELSVALPSCLKASMRLVESLMLQALCSADRTPASEMGCITTSTCLAVSLTEGSAKMSLSGAWRCAAGMCSRKDDSWPVLLLASSTWYCLIESARAARRASGTTLTMAQRYESRLLCLRTRGMISSNTCCIIPSWAELSIGFGNFS
mmetsp:Transcript_25821/g.59562  ORF Transcript_25821/g.59562 Transcript_25821/m.59562 type:complete len:320 (-) Transcript_25821:1545-2504(-)